ncbi:MAG: FtsX-like permease family protein [Pirellulales bacterium]|nr:FtsX-like permease family protein [Pirellulales bacterium]
MTPALWKYSVRAIRRRPGRAALTLLSVVIGVAAVVSVSIATSTTQQAYREMFANVSGRASLEVVANGGGSYDQEVLKTVEQVPGVETAVPVVQRPTIMYLGGRRVKLVAMGIDPMRDRAVRRYEVQRGTFLDGPGGVVLEADFAKALGIDVGREVKFLTRKGMQRMQVAGLLDAKGAGALRLGGLVFMRLEVAQHLFGVDGELDAIQIVLRPDAGSNTVREAIARLLPVGLDVRRPAARSQLVEETLHSSNQGLRMATAFSLLLAAFIILNTFLMNVGERRQQLALLRAVGATRRQIVWLLVRESLVMGGIGTALGIVVGLFGAYLLTHSLTGLLQVSLPSMILTAQPFLLAALFGFGLSLVGAAVPARRASRLTPLEALGAVAPDDMEGVSYKSIAAGLLITLVSAGLLTGVMAGWLPAGFGPVPGVFLLVGLVFLLPLGLDRLAHWVALPLRPLLGAETRLAERQVLRHRARSTLTIGVLFLAASTGIGLGNAILDNVQDVRDWYHQTVAADFFIRAMMPDMATGLSADLPEELGDEIRQVPGITNIDTARFVQAKAAGQSVVIIVREFTDPERMYFDLEKGDPQEVRRRLHEGGVVIATVLAQRAGLGAGDAISIETREGTRTLRIAGLADEYLVGGLAVYMQRDVARRLLGVSGVDAYIIQADQGRLADVKQRLQSLAEKHGALLHSLSDIRRMIDGMVDRIEGALWGVLVLGFIVAAIGVVNTLTMNVLEQTRELGLLRIVAMTRRQVRRTILLQAVMMGAIGLVPGTLAGVCVAYLVYLATAPVTGHTVEFIFRPTMLAGSLMVAIGIVIAAAWIPAARAARLNASEALHYQ